MRLAPKLAEVRRLYVETDMPNKTIGMRYGQAANWVNNLATKYGWPIRLHRNAGKLQPTQPRRAHSHKPKTATERLVALRAEDAARDHELYAGIVEEVAMLRRCGYVVTREADKVLVGNKLCTFAEVVALAARERRLRLPAQSFFEVRA